MNMFPGPDTRRRVIQFWSDASGKEFAVRLSNDHDFRAVSNPAAKYTRLVEEAEYFSDMKYDWKFLLEFWAMQNGKIGLFDLDGKKKESSSAALDLTGDIMQTYPVKADGRRRVRREKPNRLLKCRYCMLSYNSEKERQEHELVWHSKQLKDGSKR